MTGDIHNNESKQRFEMYLDGKLGYVEYRLFDNGIIFSHTEVDKALEGQGVASALAHHVLEYAKDNNLKVVPTCPFIKVYIRRHPEYEALL